MIEHNRGISGSDHHWELGTMKSVLDRAIELASDALSIQSRLQPRSMRTAVQANDALGLTW
jgi:hypothetical protein